MSFEPTPTATKTLKPGKWYGRIALLCALEPVLFLGLLLLYGFTLYGLVFWSPSSLDFIGDNLGVRIFASLFLLSGCCLYVLGFGSLLLPLVGIIFGILGLKTEGRTHARIGIGLSLLYVIPAYVFLACAVPQARETARRMQCVSTPKQLSLALRNYHDWHEFHHSLGTFPPAYSTDEEGKPLHSWRVLILPYIEGKQLYNEIRLDEPWDSPHNSQFHDKMPRIFYCPSRPAEEQTKGLTPYQMVIGPDTISNGPNSTKLSDITRNKGDTLLVVEASVSVPWMKPVDLPQSALTNGVVSSVPRRGQPVVHAIGSPHYNGGIAFSTRIPGANVAMVDTSCLFFTTDMSPEELLEKSRIRNAE